MTNKQPLPTLIIRDREEYFLERSGLKNGRFRIQYKNSKGTRFDVASEDVEGAEKMMRRYLRKDEENNHG